MRLPPRLVRPSIITQITAIVATSLLLGFGLVIAVVFALSNGDGSAHTPAAAAARIVGHSSHLLLAPTALILTIIVIFVTLLSVYAVRSIIAPLASLATAAQSFGRSAEDTRLASGNAPREIAQVAEALEEMRTRIRALLDERTRVLTAISHDLRTPLTRLRLRAERVADQELREGMMQEVACVTHMLDETLHYLREDVRAEHLVRIDLPSVLQTVCAEFADVGYAVSYAGPPRLTWTCRPNLLKRAITNIVDNAVKHALVVTVSLRSRDDGTAQIDIADDGPGIPVALRARVFDPFFKGDDARGAVARGGFGLGLSIARDVVKSHGGEIELVEGTQRGLIVRLSLPVRARAG